MSKTSIFIADDHALIRDGIKRILSDHRDFEVIGESENGLDTVRLVKKNPPDILLLDISMPRLNGFQIVKKLKNLDNMKVVILTVHNSEPHIIRLLKAGVHGYIIKTAPAQELILALEAVAKNGYYLDPTISGFIINKYLDNLESNDINDWDGLTNRELEVLKLIAEGYKNQEIADLLGLSVKTIESHRYNIMDKLDMHDRLELTKYALRRGIIQL